MRKQTSKVIRENPSIKSPEDIQDMLRSVEDTMCSLFTNDLVENMSIDPYNSTINLALIKACQNKDIDTIKRMIELGGDIDIAFNKPLKVACDSGDVIFIEWLISHGANLEYNAGWILEAAFLFQKNELVDLAMLHHADVTLVTRMYVFPIFEKKNFAFLFYFLEKMLQVNKLKQCAFVREIAIDVWEFFDEDTKYEFNFYFDLMRE